MVLSVVRSHYRDKETPENIYAAGESIAAWLGLGSWVEVVTMQRPESVTELRRRIAEASRKASKSTEELS